MHFLRLSLSVFLHMGGLGSFWTWETNNGAGTGVHLCKFCFPLLPFSFLSGGIINGVFLLYHTSCMHRVKDWWEVSSFFFTPSAQYHSSFSCVFCHHTHLFLCFSFPQSHFTTLPCLFSSLKQQKITKPFFPPDFPFVMCSLLHLDVMIEAFPWRGAY